MISVKINTKLQPSSKAWYIIFLFLLISCNTKSTIDDKGRTSKDLYSTRSIINANHFSFPNGKLKALIMSFDDGSEHDRQLLKKLNAANIVGTFHLNSGRLGQKADWLSSELGYDIYFVNDSEVSTIYTGHEISGHTFNHKGLNDQNDSIIAYEVLSNFDLLNKLIRSTSHKPLRGLAYPFGAYDDYTVKTLKMLNVEYARTTESTFDFELPYKDFLTLDPTCHISDAVDFANYFIHSTAQKMRLLNIWGHSYEFHNNWKLADSICSILGNNEQIWYAKTAELVDYIQAIKDLSYSEGTVFNPSKNISVWVKDEDEKYLELPPQKSIKTSLKSSFITVNSIDRLYPSDTTNTRYHGNWTKVHYKQRIEAFKKSPLNSDNIVFIGNSITEQGEDWREKVNILNARNRGVAGDMTDGVLKRLDEIIYYKPSKIFLLIGINDLFNLHFQKQIPSVEYVADNIIKITEKIHEGTPKTKIYVQTILPTSEEYMRDYIEQVNFKIRDHKQESVYELIDLHQEFVAENGLIKPNLTSDGTHLNELGYKVWIKAIKDKL